MKMWKKKRNFPHIEVFHNKLVFSYGNLHVAVLECEVNEKGQLIIEFGLLGETEFDSPQHKQSIYKEIAEILTDLYKKEAEADARDNKHNL